MAVPTDFAGLTLWLDATDLQDPTIPLQGEAISQWSDKSGNNRHFTASGISRPMRMDKASPSGLSVVRFDGGDDVMQSAATWADVSNGSIYTLFVVICVIGKASEDTTNLFNNDLIFGSGATNYAGLNAKNTGTALDILAYNWDGTADIATAATNAYNTFYIVQSDHSTTGQGQLNLRINGGAAQSVTTGATTNMTFPLKLGTVGGGSVGAFEYCEIIVYNSVLSTANRQAIEQYLTDRWLTPPGTALTNTKMHFFREGFKTLDNSKWGHSVPAATSIVDDKLRHTATSAILSTSGANANMYDITNSWLYGRVWPDKGGPQRWCGLYLMKDAYNYAYWFSFGTTNLYARKTQAGFVTELGNIVYDPVQHAYWRIEHTGGNLVFRTAPDPIDGSGHVWTTRFTTSAPTWPLHICKAHIQTSDLDLISCVADYDNINLRPATEHTLTLDDDTLIAGGGVEGSNLLKAFVMDESGNWST